MASVPERFLPVEPVVRQLLKESYPDLITNPGSAIYDTFVLPASVLYQRMRDTARVMQRNQALSNFSLMLPEELDRLASNFLVSRKRGTNAIGTQRVYFDDIQAVAIDSRAVFISDTGQRFRTATEVRVLPVELAANRLSDGTYFVDVAIISEGVGSTFVADPSTISQVQGVVGATATENLARLEGGDDEESNTELFLRIRNSLSNQELVKKDGIAATLQAEFPGVRSVLVQGYGDPLQSRDVLRVASDISTLVPASFAQKVNLPLDTSGEVLWTSEVASNLSEPVGGFTGAIVDLTGLDFNNLKVSPDGTSIQNICVQSGNLVRFMTDGDPDTVGNDYRITRVEKVPIELGGDPVLVLRLDRPLLDTATVGDQIDKTEYQILGNVFTDNFHIGGKVDVYVDSLGEAERTVVVSSVPATSTTSDVGKIPLTLTATDDFGNSLFEDGGGFQSPVMTITKVEQIDFINDDEVIRELIPGTHYSVVRADVRGKFTSQTDDELIVRGSEQLLDPITNQTTGDVIPLFVGQRLRITYVTNPDINTIQTFVDSSSQRDVSKDMQILPANLVNVGVTLNYTGTSTELEVASVVQNFIDDLAFDQPLCASDLSTALSFFGVSKVDFPITLSARRSDGSGSTQFEESSNTLTPSLGEIFRADSTMRITKQG